VRSSAVPVVPMAAQGTLLGVLLWALALAPGTDGYAAVVGVAGVVLAVASAVGGWLLLARALARHGRRSLGPADHVTVTRGTLACVVVALTTHVVAGAVTGPTAQPARVSLVVLASVALSLDAVDGWLARRTRTATPLGARLDMEVDAFLILVLSVAAGPVVGWWVLAIGLFRYLLVVATWVAPWLGGTVPPRYWRKAVAALQGIVLTVAVAAVLPPPAATLATVAALALLAWSFGTQGAELWRARAAAPLGWVSPGRGFLQRRPAGHRLAAPPVAGSAAAPVLDGVPVQRVRVVP
jgi:phosphatidylglycerophosphate synthase